MLKESPALDTMFWSQTFHKQGLLSHQLLADLGQDQNYQTATYHVMAFQGKHVKVYLRTYKPNSMLKSSTATKP
jgi:hypothetical protein